jgi:hypothetical protein
MRGIYFKDWCKQRYKCPDKFNTEKYKIYCENMGIDELIEKTAKVLVWSNYERSVSRTGTLKLLKGDLYHPKFFVYIFDNIRSLNPTGIPINYFVVSTYIVDKNIIEEEVYKNQLKKEKNRMRIIEDIMVQAETKES